MRTHYFSRECKQRAATVRALEGTGFEGDPEGYRAASDRFWAGMARVTGRRA